MVRVTRGRPSGARASAVDYLDLGHLGLWKYPIIQFGHKPILGVSQNYSK